MYITADCCSQTDTLPVMFSVRHPPPQHAAHIQSSLISNFSNMQPHFNIQQIYKTQLHRCYVNQYMSFFYITYIPLCYMYVVKPNCRQQKYLLVFIPDRIQGQMSRSTCDALQATALYKQ